MLIEFLLRHQRRTGDDDALAMAMHTLRRMAAGGIRDHLGGGFHRYSVDARWLVPHFEKMLYDNALLARAYLEAWQVTGADDLRAVCESTLDYVLGDLRHPEGGFLAARDADSEGEEGRFYVWSPAEVDDVLGSEEGALFRRVYDVSETGNFEGMSIPNLPHSVAAIARREGISAEALEQRLAEARTHLLAARAARPEPFRDTKVITGWRALMARSLAEAGGALERADYLEAARAAVTFTLSSVRDADAGLLHVWTDGRAKIPALLEDVAALGNALVSLHEATLEPRWLPEVVWLCEDLHARFWDEVEGLFYDTAADAEALVVRPREVADNALPSGNSLAVELLLRAVRLLDRADWRGMAERVLEREAPQVAQWPLGFGHLLTQLEEELAERVEVVIVGERADPSTRALLGAALRPFLPGRVVTGSAPGEKPPVAVPLLDGKTARAGRAANRWRIRPGSPISSAYQARRVLSGGGVRCSHSPRHHDGARLLRLAPHPPLPIFDRIMATKTGTRMKRELEVLSGEQLMRMYRTMVMSRRIDDQEIALKRQNKIFFQISGAGHEAIGVAVAEHLKPAYDWFFLYYRDRALSLALGQTPLDHLLQAVAAADDPSSGGRQMPAHYGDRRLHVASTSSPTGTQYLQAVGAAEVTYRAGLVAEIGQAVEDLGDGEVVLVTSGEGTTSEGEFWEALNTACTLKLPIVFVIEDNGYAISVPVEVQTAGGSISKLVGSFPDLRVVECDGTDVVATYRAAGDVVSWARERNGPGFLHAHCTRPYSHSVSDDDRLYRPPAEREEQERADALARTRRLLIDLEIATEEELRALEKEVQKEVGDAATEALTHPQPDPATATRHLYSEEVDPTSLAFDSEDGPDYQGGRDLTMVDLLNACLKDELERDARVVVFGQDVADASSDAALAECRGKGGVFKVTHGLQTKFGGGRVFNSPLAEANIVGRAIGMAIRGLRPIVEIQFFDYIWPAFHQIRNELATLRYRSNGSYGAHVVIRVTYGGYLKGGAIYHSQTGATLFAHTPGLRVVLPSTAEDASGLLRTAIRCEDPVLFLEHKHLYRQVYNKGRDPGPDFMIPFGKAKVVRQGTDLTVVTCGALVKRSLDAARRAADEHGIETEVIDLRTISPLDMDRVGESVKKTGKALVVHEDALSFGIGAEVAARIADDLFAWMDGPVRRIASLDSWVAYAPELEDVILPQTSDVLEGIVELVGF